MTEGGPQRGVSSRTGLTAMLALILGTMLALPAGALPLVNGDFETGDLTGWTLFTTSFNGAHGSVGDGVTPFDTNEDTVASNAAQFNVGQKSPALDYEGGGIYQDLTLGAGFLYISADIATFKEPTPGVPPGSDDNEGGLFELLVNDVVQDSYDFGLVLANETHSAELLLAGLEIVTPGDYRIAFQITRPFKTDLFQDPVISPTPRQYVDDINVTLVPEPHTLMLLSAGLLGLIRLRRSGH
jgi:hypothetical protein